MPERPRREPDAPIIPDDPIEARKQELRLLHTYQPPGEAPQLNEAGYQRSLERLNTEIAAGHWDTAALAAEHADDQRAREREGLERRESEAIGDASNHLAEAADIIRDRLAHHPHTHELQNLIAETDRLLRKPDLDRARRAT
jgi:hypothetical protein